MSNYVALHEFFEFCLDQGMNVRIDRGWIDARVAFQTDDDAQQADARVRLSKHSGDRHQVAIEEGAFDPSEVPHDYPAEYGSWSFDRDMLTIEGHHRLHGDYVTSIRFLAAD